jgi:hypothetical protein
VLTSHCCGVCRHAHILACVDSAACLTSANYVSRRLQLDRHVLFCPKYDTSTTQPPAAKFLFHIGTIYAAVSRYPMFALECPIKLTSYNYEKQTALPERVLYFIRVSRVENFDPYKNCSYLKVCDGHWHFVLTI